MPYRIDELDLKNDSEAEQKRTRDIFEDLRDKTVRSESLTEHEKDFFCKGVHLSHFDDGRIEQYSCCSNYKFKFLYLCYFHNLLGYGSYQKPLGTSTYSPKRGEIENDIAYLSSVSTNWLNQINIQNHTEELLKQISKETRDALKEVEKSKGLLLFRRDKENYLLNRRATLLQSKYIYCKALQIFEMFDRQDFILNLNGQSIEINEFSIIHVLSRHFSQITKQNPTKSFHNEDFDPKILNKQLKAIFDEIENSGVYTDQSINKITFKYEGIDYRVWVNKRTKQVAGTGNVEFNRLETFYPLTDQEEVMDINDNYELHMINGSLGIYLKT
jgi:hypothetical protein